MKKIFNDSFFNFDSCSRFIYLRVVLTRERIDTKKELDVLMNKIWFHATDYASLIADKKQLENAKDHSMAINRIRREVYTNKKFSSKQRQKVDDLISALEKKEKGVSQWFFTRWDVQYA